MDIFSISDGVSNRKGGHAMSELRPLYQTVKNHGVIMKP